MSILKLTFINRGSRMKKLNLFILLWFVLNNPFLCQSSVGFNAGYTQLKMEDVNNEFNVYQDATPFTKSNNISGSLFLEGNFKYTISPIIFGISSNYISSSGSFVFNMNGLKLYEEIYNVSCIEILGLLETAYEFNGSPLKLFIQLAGGIGLASAEQKEYLAAASVELPGIELNNNYGGNYFSGRLKGGLQYVINSLIFEFSFGYRFANAGKLELDSSLPQPDYIQGISSPYQVYVEELEFDYSGFLISAGVSFYL